MDDVEGNPFVDLLRSSETADEGIRAMTDVIQRHVKTWIADGSKEKLAALQHLLNKVERLIWDSVTNRRLDSHLQSVAKRCRESRETFESSGQLGFQMWLTQSVGELLYADRTLLRDQLAALLRVHPGTISRSPGARRRLRLNKHDRRIAGSVATPNGDPAIGAACAHKKNYS